MRSAIKFFILEKCEGWWARLISSLGVFLLVFEGPDWLLLCEIPVVPIRGASFVVIILVVVVIMSAVLVVILVTFGIFAVPGRRRAQGLRFG